MIPRTHQQITFLPILHGRLEFATVVREHLLAHPPARVAVELPGTWREPILRAVNRLPFLSLIVGAEGESQLALPVEPTDGAIEALRTARELGLGVELIDLDVSQYPMQPEPAPDPYAVARMGYDAFLAAYYAETPRPAHPLDAQRETMMAHALQQLTAQESGAVVCVLGAAHLPGVLERLDTPQPRPLGRAKPRALKLYNWSLRSSREFMTEPPFLAAAYERWRQAGALAVDDEGFDEPPGPRLPVEREVESEKLMREAALIYEDRTKQPVRPNRLWTLGRFARKYALVDGLLVPDLFQLVTAGRGVVDDDFAYELWELGSHYPWQDNSELLPTIDLDERFVHAEGRRMTLYRRLRRRRPPLRGFARKKRLKELYGGRWKQQWSGFSICSHPPEDLVIEDYGRYLRHKAGALMSAEHTRVEPFTVSLKDGIDVRETLRNWHEGTVYVRDVRAHQGRVGAVVVVFEEDPPGREGEERYPWRVTWLGEHEQESDMAFYATPAGDDVVGPGISRCEYGGFLMTYPPQRLDDVWRDPYFNAARSKAERLLFAALDYAEERNVLYVAERPPRSWFRTVAERMGRRLVYLPLGQLNPGTLRKVRRFHVLDGHHVRAYAHEYID